MNHFASEPIIYIWVYITRLNPCWWGWIPVGRAYHTPVLLAFPWKQTCLRPTQETRDADRMLRSSIKPASGQSFLFAEKVAYRYVESRSVIYRSDIDQFDIRPHTKSRSNVVLQLGKRRRRWPNCKTTLFRSLAFAGHLWETPHDNVVILKWRCLCPAHDHLHFSCSHIPIGDTWYLTLATDNTFFVQVFCFCQTGSPGNQ